MSHLRKTLLACVALVLFSGIVGCSDQTGEANRLVDQANAVTDKSNALDAEVTDLLAQVEVLDPIKNAAQATSTLTVVETKLDEMRTYAESKVALFDEIAGLDVSHEFRIYAAQQKEIAQLEVERAGVTGDLLAKLKILYYTKQMSKVGSADFHRFSRELADIYGKLDELDSQLGEKRAASDQYFTDRGLGQPKPAEAAAPVGTARESTTTTDGILLTMRLPEGDLHPGPCPVVLTLRNHSREVVLTGPVAFSASVWGPDGRLIWAESIPKTLIGIYVYPGRSLTSKETVELPGPGVYDVVGSCRLDHGGGEQPVIEPLRTTLLVSVVATSP